MVLSFLILLIFYFLIFIEESKEIKGNYFRKLFLIGFSFLLLQMLRVYGQSFFPDIPEYKMVFNSIKSIDFVLMNGYGLEHYEKNDEYGGLFAVPIEVGFLILISVFKLFSQSFDLFLFVISAVQLFIFYIFSKKLKVNIFVALMVYTGLIFITFQLGMLRQSMAFCFFLIALMNIEKKLVYAIIIFLGFTFHKSILVCLFLLYSNIFINRKLIYIVSIFALVLYTFKIDLITKLVDIIFETDGFEFGRIGFYLDVNRNNNYLGIGFWERLILLFLINVAYIDISNRNLVTANRNLMYNIGLFAIIFQLIYFSSPTITSRLRYYFAIFPILFLFDYICLFKDSVLRRILVFFIFIYLQVQIYILGSYLIT